MNLYLIENDAAGDLLSASREYQPGSDRIVCFNYLPYFSLKRGAIRHAVHFLEELIDSDEYSALHSVSDRIAFNWFLSDGSDFTSYEGISFGDVVRMSFSRNYMLTVLLKYGLIIQNAVRRWPDVETVYCDFSNSHNSFHIYEDDNGRFFNKIRLVEEVSGLLGKKCVLLKPSRYIPSISKSRLSGGKPKGLKASARNLIERTIVRAAHSGVRKPPAGGRTHFQSYYNQESMPSAGYDNIVFDTLSIKDFVRSPVSAAYRFLKFDHVPYRPTAQERSFCRLLRETVGTGKFLERLENLTELRGISYSFLYLPAIRDLTERVIPDLVAYAARIKTSFERYGIRRAVLNEELGERSQILLAVGRTKGITTIWVDHGIQSYHYAQQVYARDKSDVVICPGNFFISYYQAQRRNRRTLTLGNPVMDYYPASKRKRVSSIRNIMILPFSDGFYSRLDRYAYQELYFKELFSAFGTMQKWGMNLYLRPHPSSNMEYYRYLFAFFNVDAGRLTILEQGRFPELIYDMDLVISNVSTCFFEAQAAGVPTVFFEPVAVPGALLKPLSGVNGEEVLRVSNCNELLKLLERNKDRPDELNRFLDNFLSKHCGEYTGPLDGASARRIAAFLSDCIFPEQEKATAVCV